MQTLIAGFAAQAMPSEGIIFLANWLTRSTVILAMAGSTILLWRNASAAKRHLIWCLALLGLLLLPVMALAPIRWALPIRSEIGNHAKPRVFKAEPLASHQVLPTQLTLVSEGEIATPQSTWHREGLIISEIEPGWLSLAWGLGSLTILCSLALSFVQLYRLYQECSEIRDPGSQAAVARMARTFGVQRPIRLLTGPGVVQPMTWGIFRHVIFLPSRFCSWPKDRQEMVLRHEMGHIIRRDCLMLVLTRLALALYWWHPLVWLGARQARLERERACDDLVLNAGFKPSDYANNLLSILRIAGSVSRLPVSAIAIAIAKSSGLERRLKLIVAEHVNRSWPTNLNTATFFFLMLAVIVAMSCIGFQIQAAAQPSDPPRMAGSKKMLEVERYNIVLYPATKIYDSSILEMNNKLGFIGPGFIFEDFEDRDLVSELSMTSEASINVTTTTGQLESRYTSSVWDGVQATPLMRDVQFKILTSKVRLFGIGVGDNDLGREKLSINGSPFIQLNQLPHFYLSGGGRAYYLIIEAQPGASDIKSIEFRDAFTLMFDHLALFKLEPDQTLADRPLKATIQVVDGSRIIGIPTFSSLMVQTTDKKLDIPVKRIAAIQFQKDKQTAIIELRNGEKLIGSLKVNSLEFSIFLGKQQIDLRKINKLLFYTPRIYP